MTAADPDPGDAGDGRRRRGPWAGAALAVAGVLAIAAVVHATSRDNGAAAPTPDVAVPTVELNWRLGGLTTTRDDSYLAFNRSARNLGLDDRIWFAVGDRVFEHFFTAREGLGPGFNGTGCMSCHVNNGRGLVPAEDGPVSDPGMVAKVSLDDPAGATPVEVPGFGLTVQTQGEAAEGVLAVTWEEIGGTYPDGTPYTLRRPHWTVDGLPDDARLSVRATPHLAGVGLLEAIDAADVVAAADPDDVDGDGISGRPQWVPDPDGGPDRLGRFGWRAAMPSVLDQTATAFAEDMGISTSRRLAPGDDGPELSDDDLDATAFYSVGLAVPAMRGVDDPDVITGAGLFEAIGCASCHTPRHRTGDDAVPGIARQDIWPYTDLLLHDLGPGLADGRAELEAGGSEWRTPPLWGLGLHRTVNGNAWLLHDGRARSPEEAVLWHGGEAAASRDAYVHLDADQRAQLLTFLDGL